MADTTVFSLAQRACSVGQLQLMEFSTQWVYQELMPFCICNVISAVSLSCSEVGGTHWLAQESFRMPEMQFKEYLTCRMKDMASRQPSL